MTSKQSFHFLDLPEQEGTYILIALVLQMKRLKIGRL